MGMSDCEKCWNTPCTCGWDYHNNTKKERMKLASVILGVSYWTLKDKMGRDIPKEHPMKKGKK